MESLKVKPYKKSDPHSYIFGAYSVLRLMEEKPEIMKGVLIHSKYDDIHRLIRLCKNNDIPYLLSDKTVNRLSDKENIYVIGIFDKYEEGADASQPHIVLINPSNMGNLGTIIRTVDGFNIKNIVIITPAADIFNPKVLRASMGSLFAINFQHFASFSDYQTEFPFHELYPFMLKNALALEDRIKTSSALFSLVFGNESSGLPDKFSQIGKPIKIPQSDTVDSLNLGVAVGVATYSFALHHKLIK